MYSSNLQGLRPRKKKPFHERELIYSYVEVAKVLSLTLMSIYRYRRDFADVPKPITSKGAVMNWARRHGIPRKRGPLPGEMRREVVRLREQGKTFREIGKLLWISHQAAHGHWRRHLHTCAS